MDQATLQAGTEVGGYTIREPLGAGAMGAVYRAVDGEGVEVALKVLHAHLDRDGVARERLRREVAALQRLRHPAVARILDAELDGEQAFVVTELVPGRTLAAEIVADGPLGAGDLHELADQLAGALDSVHLAGVVHRDLKPSNVMITPHGPVLIDFGIATGFDDVVPDDPADGSAARAGDPLTLPGFVIGTPGYLAPELLDGAAATPDSDWWSWAALLAFAATGRPPFGTRPADLVLRRSREGRVDLVGLPARTAHALAGALQSDPQVRWSAAAVIPALRADAEDAALAGAGTAKPTIAPTESVSGPSALSPANDGLTRAVAAEVVGVPGTVTVIGEGPVISTESVPIPLGEVRYRSFADLAAANVADEPLPYQAPVPGKRRLVLLLCLVPLLVLGATRPLVAVGVLAILLAICRVAGHANTAFHQRRVKAHGPRPADLWVALATSPWHLVRGVGTIIPQMLVSLAAGFVVTFGGFWLLAPGRVLIAENPDALGDVPANHSIVFAVLMAITTAVIVVVAWFGPAGRVNREGARLILNKTAPPPIGSAVVMAACLIGAWLLLEPLLGLDLVISWWPFSETPSWLPGPELS